MGTRAKRKLHPKEPTKEKGIYIMERERSAVEQEGEMAVAAAWGLGAIVIAAASSLSFFRERAKEIQNFLV